jgi:hypothetical protein
MLILSCSIRCVNLAWRTEAFQFLKDPKASSLIPLKTIVYEIDNWQITDAVTCAVHP